MNATNINAMFLILTSGLSLAMAGATQNSSQIPPWAKDIVRLQKKIDFRRYPWAKPTNKKKASARISVAKKPQTNKPAINSAKPTLVSNKDSKPITQPAGKIDFTVSDPSEFVTVAPGIFRPMTPAEYAAEQATEQEEWSRKALWLQKADQFVEKGDFAKARPIYEQELRDVPGDETTALSLAKLCLKEGKVDEMYALTIGGITKSSSRNHWLWASLALSLKGQVVEGQRDYLVDGYFRGIDSANLCQSDSSVKTLQILSALALGCSMFGPYSAEPVEQYFMGMVLRLDSNNPMAHDLLGRIALRHYRGAEAVAEFSETVKYAKGDIKVAAQQDLNVANAVAYAARSKHQ